MDKCSNGVHSIVTITAATSYSVKSELKETTIPPSFPDI